MTRSVRPLFLACILLHRSGIAGAVVPDADVRIFTETETAWTGQGILFSIEIRAPGTFDGSAAFDLPEVSQSVLLKVGNPVLGSDSSGEVEVFSQTHPFMLFSQLAGRLNLPPVTVRFSHHRGYTGPSYDVTLKTEPLAFTIQRPPGSEGRGFLVTTRDLAIAESWDPEPNPAEVGAVFTRTIAQRSAGLTGMALAPAPSETPDGVRLYEPTVEVNDATTRGDFIGERTETLTYLFEEAGIHTLPAITYSWWNPEEDALASHTLPARTFEIVRTPQPSGDLFGTTSPPGRRMLLLSLIALALLGATAIHQRVHLASIGSRVRAALFAPERTAASHLLRACRNHDAEAAFAAWQAWRLVLPIELTPDLQAASCDLLCTRFGPDPALPWQGDALAVAVRAYRRRQRATNQPSKGVLPPLNPTHHA